jgi:hypothetical protein
MIINDIFLNIIPYYKNFYLKEFYNIFLINTLLKEFLFKRIL